MRGRKKYVITDSFSAREMSVSSVKWKMGRRISWFTAPRKRRNENHLGVGRFRQMMRALDGIQVSMRCSNTFGCCLSWASIRWAAGAGCWLIFPADPPFSCGRRCAAHGLEHNRYSQWRPASCRSCLHSFVLFLRTVTLHCVRPVTTFYPNTTFLHEPKTPSLDSSRASWIEESSTTSSSSWDAREGTTSSRDARRRGERHELYQPGQCNLELAERYNSHLPSGCAFLDITPSGGARFSDGWWQRRAQGSSVRSPSTTAWVRSPMRPQNFAVGSR